MIPGATLVTALVVTHDGAPFVDATLDGLRSQTRAPELCLGVDAGSVDDSRTRLMAGLPEDSVILDVPGKSFGQAVRAALDHLPSTHSEGVTEWLWLLHDDSAPRPDTLERLLDAVEKAPSATVAGPKQLDATRPERLLEVGATLTTTGHRFSRVGTDEVDQGQYDSVSDTLGVSTAGMLVRRDVLQALGGFDQALPGIGDDVDLGRRMWLAGHRVLLVPDAAMEHQPDSVEAVTGPRVEARAAAYTRLKYAPGFAAPFLAVWMIVAGLGRALGRFVAKDPRGAATEVGAGFTGIARLGKVLSGRRDVARNKRVPSGVIKSLLATPAQVRDRTRTLREERLLPDAPHSTTAAQPKREASGGDDDFEALDEGPRPAGSATGGLIAVLISAALSVLGMYKLLGASVISGGSLLAPGTVIGEAWSRATDFVQPPGLGTSAPPDPFDLLIWLLQLVTAGHAQEAGAVLWLIAMPLAALTAWFALGAVTSSSGFRFFGAVAFSLSPSLLVALSQGLAGTVVVHVVLPLLFLALIRAVGAARTDTVGGHVPGTGGTPSWAATAAASLLAAVVVAAEPLLIVVLVLGCLIAAFVSRRSRNLWWVPIPALALAAPLFLHALSSPRALLVQPGLPLAADPAPVWQQLLGWPLAVDTSADLPGLQVLGSGWIWAALAAVVIPLALFALPALLAPRSAVARTVMLIGLVTLAGGVAAARLHSTVVGESTVGPFTGSFVSAFVLAVLYAAGSGRDLMAGRRIAATSFRRGLTTILALGTLAASVVWVAPRLIQDQDAVNTLSTAALVNKGDASELPATSADRGTGPLQQRTLSLEVSKDGRITAEVADGAGTRLEDLSATVAANKLKGNAFLPHTTQRAKADDGTTAVREVVAALASGEGTDVRSDLADLAVSSVVLTSDGTGAEVLSELLDSVPGLSPVGRSTKDQSWIWWVDTAAGASDEVAESGSSTSRVRIVSADGSPQALIENQAGTVDRVRVASGDSDRVLVLSERADSAWKATINGKELAATEHGWAQAWEVPASGGTLSIHRSEPWTWVWLTALSLALLVSLLSIIPVPRAWRVDARTQRTYRPTVAQRRKDEDSDTDEEHQQAAEEEA
ncbi:MAG: glycosyltransferase family 2 protein [Galactobacter sp.]